MVYTEVFWPIRAHLMRPRYGVTHTHTLSWQKSTGENLQ